MEKHDKDLLLKIILAAPWILNTWNSLESMSFNLYPLISATKDHICSLGGLKKNSGSYPGSHYRGLAFTY